MNSYFLHNGIESSGPFTLEELKSKNIKPNTPVWCQGMPDWKTAAEVEELKFLITVIPPPLKRNDTVATSTVQNIKTENQLVEKKQKAKRIFGLKKSVFFSISLLAVLIIASLFLNFYQENRRAELELKNKQTEKDNIQYRLQQKEIEEQKIQLAIQEKIEADRLLNNKKETIKNRLFSNEELLISANTNFENAKKKLADASNFQFFRSSEERAEQIDQAQKEVTYWKKEIEKITNENDQLKLELEKIR
ncbi:DUF4339 domain-containing protein [Flavobacterium sp. NG2]|uniref:DUF4339 domain-containing protein n=1 Tax=Flavobacterium sp. NG2 TaxID=3097547 RepID=UPI002A806749|nr:DUF4339 domain-containing protein [Flavobacterium sp. NG2]WPR70654.1 DUF4339 domain-containing protein [Flavobacterium sp. NG2]